MALKDFENQLAKNLIKTETDFRKFLFLRICKKYNMSKLYSDFSTEASTLRYLTLKHKIFRAKKFVQKKFRSYCNDVMHL